MTIDGGNSILSSVSSAKNQQFPRHIKSVSLNQRNLDDHIQLKAYANQMLEPNENLKTVTNASRRSGTIFLEHDSMSQQQQVHTAIERSRDKIVQLEPLNLNNI